MNSKKFALFALLVCALAPVSHAQVKHIQMRVEGMT
jgi:hypothetical protein